MTPLRILIAEDSQSIAESIRQRLEVHHGFECIVARNCAEATRIMEAEGPGLFLAILDLMLPDAPQGEVVDVARIRRIPSIAFTSRFDETTRRRILTKDVIDYIVKDANAVENLVYTVERLRQNRGVKVLVVDDSTSVRGLLKHELKRSMFKVYEASNGKTALKILERNPDIKVVIMDYRMPEMDGVTLTREIRKRHTRHEIAIIGISGMTNEPLSVNFIKNGANDFINKPFQREELYCRVIQNVEMIEQFAKLRQLDKIKNKFLGMAAHDLRNPINGIKGLSTLLRDGAVGQLNAEQDDLIATIEHASTQMLQLVNDLLDVSVMESGMLELQIEPVELENIVRKRLSFAELNAAHKSIRVKTDLQPIPPMVGDKDRISQVIDNLLSNAIKFSPRGTEVQVQLRSCSSEAIFCVRDNGPGIAPEEQKELFRSFRKGAARPTDGEASTGLGLTIVKRIVSAHKGRVWLESKPGAGSAFFVALPLTV